LFLGSMLADPLLSAGEGIKDFVTGEDKKKKKRDEMLRMRLQLMQLMDELDRRESHQAMDMTLQRLMQGAPDIANSVLANQQLPQGASTFGGTANTEDLQKLVAMLSQGQLQ